MKEREYARLKELTGDTSNPERNLNLYKMFFDISVRSRDDRTGYNKYFLTLLFIQTLVAVFTAILGNVANLTGFTKMLLTFVFAAASVISLAWFLKLWTLGRIIHAQQETLRHMERMLSLPFYMTQDFWDNLRNVTYHSRRWPLVNKWLCRINYYILPILLFATFLALAFLVYFRY